MLVAFRADASIRIGTGHVMRCLTLAEELRRQGHECLFICRAHDGHLGDLISQKGFELHLLTNPEPQEKSADYGPQLAHAEWLGCTWQKDAEQVKAILNQQQPSWLVVDHYALDANWEREVASVVGQIMVIDDLADRAHECAVLLDQNLGREASDYNVRVPKNCKKLIGPEYALLRPEFAELRPASLARRREPKLQRILISLGGVDRSNVTGTVLEALEQSNLPAKTELDVIMGAAAPYLEEVVLQVEKLPFRATVSVNVSDMAERMCGADLAIGAAGSTSWERCCLGLPCILVVLAANQSAIGTALHASGSALIVAGDDLTSKISDSVRLLSANMPLLKQVSNCALRVCEGNGCARAVLAMGLRGSV